MANKNEIVFEFRDLLDKQLIKRFGEQYTAKDIIYHLSSRGLIPHKTLRNYMMIQDFDKFLVENLGHVGNTFIDLSVKYDISEKQAKNIVYKQRKKFETKSNIRVNPLV